MPIAKAQGLRIGASASAATTTYSLNAANKWLALPFVSDANETFQSLTAYIAAIGGTQANNKTTLDIYSDVNGSPGVSIAGPVEVTNLAAAAFGTWSGFTTSMTAGVPYWFVFKNTSVAPTVDYVTIQYLSYASSDIDGTSSSYGSIARVTTTGGASWSAGNPSSLLCGIATFAGPRYYGFPVTSATDVASGLYVYGGRKYGMRFTAPSNVKLNIRTVTVMVRQQGTPTGNAKVEIVSGGVSYYSASFTATGNIVAGYSTKYIFASPISIAPGATIDIWVYNTAADSISAAYRCREWVVPNDATSKSLVSLWGSQRIYFDGSSTTATDTSIPMFCIGFDTDGEFTAPVFPTEAQTLRVADDGPATWGFSADRGPGTAIAEAHSDDEVIKSAGGNYNDDNLTAENVRSGTAFGLSLTGTLTPGGATRWLPKTRRH